MTKIMRMNIALVDLNWRNNLPLTFAKSTAHLLVGIDTIEEKWTRLTEASTSFILPEYLHSKFPQNDTADYFVNASVVPTNSLLESIHSLQFGEVLTYRGKFIASKNTGQLPSRINSEIQEGSDISFTFFGKSEKYFNDEILLIEKPSDIFSLNGDVLKKDFEEITRGIHTTAFPDGVIATGTDIYASSSAKLNHCVLNSSAGPIYIGKDVEIMEGSLIRGPFAIRSHSTLKMGAKIYGPTSIGKHCKVGGEVNNSVFNDFSNKGHDGFLGNSVVGSWCNLGADTNTSNLKNNYAKIRVWNYRDEKLSETGRQFHGAILGDHVKLGINTMLNTGTIIGMSSNVFGGNFPPKFIPSFSWGSADSGFSEFKMDKAIEAASAMMERRGEDLTDADKDIFRFVLNHDKKYQ